MFQRLLFRSLLVFVSLSQRATAITDDELAGLIKESEKSLDEEKRTTFAISFTDDELDPVSFARSAFTPTDPTSLLAAEAAEVYERATNRALLRGYSLPDIEAIAPRLPPTQRRHRFYECGRPDMTTDTGSWCDRYEPYRSPHGWCNNLMPGQEKFGASFQPQSRLLPANYEDFSGTTPRHTTSDGKSHLPSSRAVSLAVFQNEDTRTPLPNFFFQWGQYITHDIVLTPINKNKAGDKLNCKACGSVQSESQHCFPIPVASSRCEPCANARQNPGCPRTPRGCEPMFDLGACLPFVRSINAQIGLGVRAQQNELTAYIDASSVYGSTQKLQDELRESGPNAGGRLKLQRNGLPPRDKKMDGCNGADKTKCFLTGDKRNSITMGLVSMHTMWVHEHNRIVGQLARINPHWDSDTLFMEARQIVGDMHQHITYKEYLPRILGPEIMNMYGLSTRPWGFTDDYDPTCDAGIFTELATTALRFGHSQSTSMFRKGYGRGTGIWDLKENFFNPTHLYENPAENWRNLLIGLQYQQCKKSDSNFDWILQHRVFTKKGDPMSGVDLPALNIQRGRDHGLQFYRAYRQYYGLFVPNQWSDLNCCMSAKAIDSLKSVYQSVHDIEAYPGMMLERPMRDAEVGELVAHILADQFSRLKRCDRFWYESRTAPSSFSMAQRSRQLREMRKVTYTSVACGVMEGVPESSQMCKGDFGFGPPIGRASNVEPLNLDAWRAFRSSRRRMHTIFQDRIIASCHDDFF